MTRWSVQPINACRSGRGRARTHADAAPDQRRLSAHGRAQSFGGIIVLYGCFGGMRTMRAVKTHAQKTLKAVHKTHATTPAPINDIVQTVWWIA